MIPGLRKSPRPKVLYKLYCNVIPSEGGDLLRRTFKHIYETMLKHHKSLKQWLKEFDTNPDWKRVLVLMDSSDGWLVEAETNDVIVTMDLHRDGSMHVMKTVQKHDQ